MTSTPSSASGCQRLAIGVGALAVQPRGQRDLEHRHIGGGQQVHQWHPGAVVQAPLRIGLGHVAGGAQQLDGALRHVGRAGRGVLQLVERGREPAEVVDGLGRGRGGHARLARHPVRRNDQHGLRAPAASGPAR